MVGLYLWHTWSQGDERGNHGRVTTRNELPTKVEELLFVDPDASLFTLGHDQRDVGGVITILDLQ